MAQKLIGREISGHGTPLNVPKDLQAEDSSHLELTKGGVNDVHPTKPKVKHGGPMHPHSDIAGGSGREGVGGQTNVVQHEKPSVGERIKEVLPGTKEHRAKKEAEIRGTL